MKRVCYILNYWYLHVYLPVTLTVIETGVEEERRS